MNDSAREGNHVADGVASDRPLPRRGVASPGDYSTTEQSEHRVQGMAAMMSRREAQRVADFLDSVAIALGERVRALCGNRIERFAEDQEFSPESILQDACNEHEAEITDQVQCTSNVPFYSRLELK